jgi:hypothetical protein
LGGPRLWEKEIAISLCCTDNVWENNYTMNSSS